MKRIISILLTLIFLCLSFATCQKIKEPEQKKGVEAQRKELKQESSEVQAKGEGQPLISKQEAKGNQERSETKVAASQTPSETEKKSEFKEPVLLWEREFDPPLIDISDQNSSGEYIAIQGGGKEGRPTKILFLDSKGRTVREIQLGKKEKRKIPPEQVWLTHYGEQWRDEKFKKSFKAGKEIETITDRAFVSGNGEYYAILTQDTAAVTAGSQTDTYTSPWYEFAYYDRTGKPLWKALPKDNYGFKMAYISPNGSPLLLIDEAILDYFGQRWYLYDRKGDLLKTEDHLIRHSGDQEEWNREKREWMHHIDISKDGRFIAFIKGGRGVQAKPGLMDEGGRELWEGGPEQFYRIGNDARTRVSNDGKLLVIGAGVHYLVNDTGKVIFTHPRLFTFSKDGNYISGIGEEDGEENLQVYDATNGGMILKKKAGTILGNSKIKLYYPTFHSDKYLIFIFSRPPQWLNSIGMFDIKRNEIIWKKEDISSSISARYKDFKPLLLLSLGKGSLIKKVVHFDVSGR